MFKTVKSKYRSLPVQLRASFWSLVCGVLQRGIQVITTPVFTRLMAASEYGDYTAFSSWLDVLTIFLTLGLPWGAFMQGIVKYDDNREQYTSTLIGLTLALETIGLAIYLPARTLWNSLTGLTTVSMLAIFTITWSSSLFAFWQVRQRVEYRYRALLLLTLIGSVAQPSAGMFAILSFPNHKVEARVVSMAIVQMSCYGWLFFLYWTRGGKLYDCGHWKNALKFSLPLIPHHLSHSILSVSDRIMIRKMVSSTAAGIYGLSYSMSFLMIILNQAILNTLNPWIYQRLKTGEYDSIESISYIALAGVAVTNLFVVALAPEVMAFFAPEEYREGIWLVPPLAASVVIMFMFSLFSDFLFYYERTDYVMWASIIGAGLNVSLNIVLIPQFGYQAAAWTTLAGYVAYVGMHYAFMRRVQKNEMGGVRIYDSKILVSIILAFGAACVLLETLYSTPLIRYVMCIAGLCIALVKRESIITIYHRLRTR